MQLVGVLPCDQGQANHRVLIHPDQSPGLANPAAVREVPKHGHGLVLGQARIEEWRPFAFREAHFTGAAAEQAPPLGAVAGRHGQIAVATLAIIGTFRVLTAETAQIVHGGPPWPKHFQILGLLPTPHQLTFCLTLKQC